MTLWSTRPLVCVDFETTGVDPFTDRVVQVAAVSVAPDGSAEDEWTTIVNPGIEVPDEAAAVHGITTERARTEGTFLVSAFATLAPIVRKAAIGGQAVCIYNARFDWPLAICEAERAGIDWPTGVGIVDPYLIDRMCDRFRPGKRKLTLVSEHYRVPLDDEDAHGALADATAAGRVMWALLESYPSIARHSLASVMLRQIKGHEVDRQRFVSWMRSNADPEFDTPPGWPIPVEGIVLPPKVEGQGAPAPCGGDRIVADGPTSPAPEVRESEGASTREDEDGAPGRGTTAGAAEHTPSVSESSRPDGAMEAAVSSPGGTAPTLAEGGDIAVPSGATMPPPDAAKVNARSARTAAAADEGPRGVVTTPRPVHPQTPPPRRSVTSPAVFVLMAKVFPPPEKLKQHREREEFSREMLLALCEALGHPGLTSRTEIDADLYHRCFLALTEMHEGRSDLSVDDDGHPIIVSLLEAS